MLYLGAGARQITVGEDKSMYVFSDFSDPNQFYYLPNFPHIAKMEDGTPAIRMLVFREDLDTLEEDDEEAVAFLSLDVEIGWDAELVDEAASALRLEGQLNQKPRLTPIFFREGTVKLMLLDAATPDPDGEASERPSDFVTKIMGAGSPSLYGNNRAIFQASLSKKGAAALSGALDGVTPIGVVYSLTFAGLQPAFNIRAKVEWEKVTDHFSEDEHIDFLFYEKDVQKSIDKLIEDKVIEIEVTTEGVGADAMDAQREAVLQEVRQLIFNKFFEATFERETAVGDSTGDNVVDGLVNLAQSGLTLGMGYSYRRKEVRIEELRTLNLDWTVRRATEREIYPQAHMYNLLSESGITEDKLITIVDGGDAMWKVLPFEVTAAAAWETDGIAGITVDIEYDDADSGELRSWSTFLDKDKPRDEHRNWMDRTSGSVFRYKYEVVFSDGVPGPSPIINSGEEWLDHEGTVVVIHPRELYESVELEVGAIPNFAFDRWPAVQAVLRYRTEDGSFEHYEDGVLTKDSPKFDTRFRVDKGVPGDREVSLTYIGSTGERVETGWMPMPQDQEVVEDPHPDDLEVRAIVAGDRSKLANLIVNFEYRDDEHGIHEDGALMFDPDTFNKPQKWTVHLADPTRRRYRYRMTLVTMEGDFIESGWIGTDAPTLPVGEVYARRMTVEVVTGELGPGVESVEVALVYDDGGTLREEKTFSMGSNARSEWKVQLQDAGQRSYEVITTWIKDDGFNVEVGPTTHSESLLVIPGSPPE